jgi:hypothetical protein
MKRVSGQILTITKFKAFREIYDFSFFPLGIFPWYFFWDLKNLGEQVELLNQPGPGAAPLGRRCFPASSPLRALSRPPDAPAPGGGNAAKVRRRTLKAYSGYSSRLSETIKLT